MPSASLNRMSVPTGFASDQSAPVTGLLMPKLKYRFRVIFENFGGENPVELTKQVMDFTRPSVSFAEIPIDIYNSKMYLAGKHEWETVTINLRDDASNQVTRLVSQQLQRQMDFVEQASASSGIDYKFTVKCQILDGGNGEVAPVVLETWRLYGSYLVSANYQDLNYTTSEPVTIALTVRFDNANLSPGESDDTFAGSLGRTTRNIITGAGN